MRLKNYSLIVVFPGNFSMDKKRQGNEMKEKGRKWIFTSQQPGTLDIEKHIIEGHFHAMIEKAENRPTYLKMALERGESVTGKEGNLHIQGYLELYSPTTFAGVQKFLAEDFLRKPHIEFAYAPGRAAAYIGNSDFVDENGEKKGGQIFWVLEYGKSTNRQGCEKRRGADWNDGLLQMKAMLDAGETLADLWQKHFLQMIYVGAAIKAYIEIKREQDWEKGNTERNARKDREMKEKAEKQQEEEEEALRKYLWNVSQPERDRRAQKAQKEEEAQERERL